MQLSCKDDRFGLSHIFTLVKRRVAARTEPSSCRTRFVVLVARRLAR